MAKLGKVKFDSNDDTGVLLTVTRAQELYALIEHGIQEATDITTDKHEGLIRIEIGEKNIKLKTVKLKIEKVDEDEGDN